MEDIAHILWSIAIFYHQDWWIAAFFGILPDVLVFFPVLIQKLSTGKVHKSQDLSPKRSVKFFDKWVFPVYSITHSLVFVGAVIFLCSLIFGYKVEYWAMLIHVAMDIPSHPKGPFATKLFYPFSKWHLNGGSWPARDFMLANYTCLATVYLIRLLGY